MVINSLGHAHTVGLAKWAGKVIPSDDARKIYTQWRNLDILYIYIYVEGYIFLSFFFSIYESVFAKPS